MWLKVPTRFLALIRVGAAPRKDAWDTRKEDTTLLKNKTTTTITKKTKRRLFSADALVDKATFGYAGFLPLPPQGRVQLKAAPQPQSLIGCC